MAENEPLLEVKEVTKSYRYSEDAPPLEVLKGISFQLDREASVAVVGPSGSGKSTLLNIIGTLDRPTSGEVVFEGTNLAELDGDRLASIRNTRMGFIFQLHHLLPQLTALENVLVPTLARSGKRSKNLQGERNGPEAGKVGAGKEEPERKEAGEDRARELLSKVGLASRMSHFPAQLSGGERQRVAVVRALVNRPDLLLADEPTGALDRPSAESLMSVLTELKDTEGVALIVVTHASFLATRMEHVMQLSEGKLAPREKTP